MKRRQQRKVVVMHSASIHAERGVNGASAEEDRTTATSDSRKSVLPSAHLSGTFNDQIGAVAAVERADGRRGVGVRRIDYMVRAEFAGPAQTAFAAPGDRDGPHAGGFERHHMEQTKRARPDD